MSQSGMCLFFFFRLLFYASPPLDIFDSPSFISSVQDSPSSQLSSTCPATTPPIAAPHPSPRLPQGRCPIPRHPTRPLPRKNMSARPATAASPLVATSRVISACTPASATTSVPSQVAKHDAQDRTISSNSEYLPLSTPVLSLCPLCHPLFPY